MYYRPASRRLLLLAALVLSTHLLLFLLLREDPRVELYASSEELRALEINSSTYAYRAARFNTYIENEPYRSGPGEHGRGVHLKLSEDKMNELINNDGYNSIACSQIALDRSLGNRPAPECLAVSYPDQLPTTSVIIIFTDEPVRLILRTVFSVVNRSPPKLLKEVILLDDGSKSESLLSPLDDFVSKTWPDGVVRVVRLPNRVGLIRARIEGAKVATGEVLVFLDAHCEATFMWLEPLLARIKEKPNAVVCPAISNIDRFTLTFLRSDVTHTEDGYLKMRVGSFSWDGFFMFEQPKRSVVVNRRRQSDPLESVTMAGGLFAMRRDYFFALGAYDEAMEIWGGENLELSFRIWQCGGSLEFSPCSTVGHVYRSNHPYKFPSSKDFHGINTVRMVEVWMDEYKELFYLARQDLQDIDYGDISDRQRLRKELHCRNFSWLLSTHADHKFVYHKDVFGYGSLCNPSQPHYCLLRDPNVPEYRKLLTALLHIPGPISSSRWANMFALTRTGLLRKDWICVRLRRIHPYWVFSNHMVDLFECPNDYEEPEERQWWLEWQKDQSRRIKAAQLVSPLSGAQAVRTTAHRNAHFRWAYDERNGKLINAETGECLDSIAGFAPLPKPCIDGLPSQEWRFSHTVTGSGK